MLERELIKENESTTLTVCQENPATVGWPDLPGKSWNSHATKLTLKLYVNKIVFVFDGIETSALKNQHTIYQSSANLVQDLSTT